jgi:DNA-binding IclR family transcriptional regulator
MPTAAKSRSATGGRRGGRPSATHTIERTLDALEMLSERPQGIGVHELAATLGVSSPSAHRLLSTLHARGYARQDPLTARYAVGLRCFSLATLATSAVDLRAAATPHLRRLNQLTGETVHLALYDGGEVVYIDRLEGSHPVGPVSRIGARAPAHCVATGRAILAHAPGSEIDALLARGLEAYTDGTPTTPAAIEADLELVRRRGWAMNEGAWREGICGVAAPVRDPSGDVPASVGVCLPAQRFSAGVRPDLLRHTVEAAAGISADLGFVTRTGSAGARHTRHAGD